MTIEPLFSIVTVTKDNLPGLRVTAASIAAQSFRDFEWLVIDGASADGTADVLATLHCRFVSEPDSGIYHAMNKGLALATGRYLLFLNAGDALADADILATIARVAAWHDPDFIYGDALETSGLYKKARSHKRLLLGMFTHHQAMFYRREKIGTLRYDDSYRIAADYGFTAAFLHSNLNAHYIPCAICLFENGGVSERQRKLGRGEQFDIRARFCPWWKNASIYAGQTITALVQQSMPGLYRRLRTGRFF